MTDATEIEWHKGQIAGNRALLEELQAGNTAGGALALALRLARSFWTPLALAHRMAG
jgi:hypothetical protein